MIEKQQKCCWPNGNGMKLLNLENDDIQQHDLEATFYAL